MDVFCSNRLAYVSSLMLLRYAWYADRHCVVDDVTLHIPLFRLALQVFTDPVAVNYIFSCNDTPEFKNNTNMNRQIKF
jgi:hypothetical protein